jgi:hypothetical protein
VSVSVRERECECECECECAYARACVRVCVSSTNCRVPGACLNELVRICKEVGNGKQAHAMQDLQDLTTPGSHITVLLDRSQMLQYC